MPKYSVVVPVFNSVNTIEELFNGLKGFFAELGETFEIIFVDDFSKDSSWELLTRIKKENPGLVTAVRLSKNYGQHNATFCGFTFTKGDYIITIDDDLQIPVNEIIKLIRSMESSDAQLVYGYFVQEKQSWFRKMSSSSLRRTSKLFFNRHENSSSFRLITADLVGKMVHHKGFIFLEEIFQWYTDEIAFVEVEHLERKFAKSGYSTRNLFRFFNNIMLFYTMLPLKLLVYGGFTISVISFFTGVFGIIKKLFFNVQIGYTSIIVAILFTGSTILFSLGVLGEYLSRIYQVQNRKPSYSIKRVL
jgi:undecaprenyl-phosphate 4-deoxy-4-formamido-L-arabinose transferase